MAEKDINTSEEIDENTADEELDAAVEEAAELFDEAADEEDAVSEYNDVAAQIAELEEKLEDSNDKYVRLFAEYDNFRKRTAREKTEAYSNASAKCIEELLPVIDSFERSLEVECSDDNFKNGMAMIFTQLKEFMNKMNLKEIEALGAEFDPNVHNAVQQLSDTDYAAGHVCMVYQKGYMLGDKLIRPAMVAVAAD